YHPAGFLASYTRNGLGRVYSAKGDPAPDFGYGYDDRGRLTRWTLGEQDILFHYDDASNLTSHDGFVLPADVTDDLHRVLLNTCTLAGMAAHAYGANNRRADWSYDLDGRVTRDDQWTYQWDELNNVGTVLDGDFAVAQFRYDADGNRVRAVYDTLWDSVAEFSVRLPDGRLITTMVAYWALFWHYDQQRNEHLTFPLRFLNVTKDYVWHNGQ